jgi:hypothetical protein
MKACQNKQCGSLSREIALIAALETDFRETYTGDSDGCFARLCAANLLNCGFKLKRACVILNSRFYGRQVE